VHYCPSERQITDVPWPGGFGAFGFCAVAIFIGMGYPCLPSRKPLSYGRQAAAPESWRVSHLQLKNAG